MSGHTSEILRDTMGRRNRRLADRQCPACNALFRPLRAGSRFCSRPCARTINGGHNRKEESWWLDRKGYIVGRIWVDGSRRVVRQHRLVMERHIGRLLRPDEDVHHIDGNKQNNSIENLQLLSHSAHAKLSQSERTYYAKGYKLDLSDAERKARSDRMKAMRQAALASDTQSPSEKGVGG